MNQKEFANIALVGLAIAIVGVVGYFVFIQISPGNSTLPEIQYEDLSRFGSERNLACISTFNENEREREFIVNTETEYQKLLNYKSSFSPLPLCANFVLPPIDFSHK